MRNVYIYTQFLKIQYVKYGQIYSLFVCLFVCFSDCRLGEYQIQESEAVKDIDTIGLARKETEVVREIILF